MQEPEDARVPATTGAPEGGRYVTSTAALTTLSDDRKRPTKCRLRRTRASRDSDGRGLAGVRFPAVGEPGRGLRAGLVAASVVALAALQLPAAIGAGSPSRLAGAGSGAAERELRARGQGTGNVAQLRDAFDASRPDPGRARAVPGEARGDLGATGRGRAEPAPRAAHARGLAATAGRPAAAALRTGADRPDVRARGRDFGRRRDQQDRQPAPDRAASTVR